MKPNTYPHRIVTEVLDEEQTTLTDFYFDHGANIYVFTYLENGRKRHIFIDAGYYDHKQFIIPILEKNGIDTSQIDKIIITHRHMDHCGLAATLARKSDATILAHENFKNFVNGDVTKAERHWMGKFKPEDLKSCRLEYLKPTETSGTVNIRGMDFPRLGNNTVRIGNTGKLELLAAPQIEPIHTPDQILIHYSRDLDSSLTGEAINRCPAATDILFTGDLWLMTGPVFEKGYRALRLKLKFVWLLLRERLAGRRINWVSPRLQDVEVKDALKKGFSMIRVKPGHGEEFLGCRIIPEALLADRDLLVRLGYGMDEDPAILQAEPVAGRVDDLRETAYRAFKDELRFWLDTGCHVKEISLRLSRIHDEQRGGGKLVEMDRKQRKIRLKETIDRMLQDPAAPAELQDIAGSTLL